MRLLGPNQGSPDDSLKMKKICIVVAVVAVDAAVVVVVVVVVVVAAAVGAERNSSQLVPHTCHEMDEGVGFGLILEAALESQSP